MTQALTRRSASRLLLGLPFASLGLTGHPSSSDAAPYVQNAGLVAPVRSEPPVALAPTDVRYTSSNESYEMIEGIVIYRGQAVQMMSGSPSLAAPLVQAINRYQQELAPEVSVYFMAIPIGSDFYLPDKLTRGVMREKILIDGAYARLNPGVRAVAAYDPMAEHADEYLYFNTDHHWTGLGAYYAYTAFAKAARFNPLPLSALTKADLGNFLGTLYSRTKSQALKDRGDKIECYKIPRKTEVTVFNGASRTGTAGRLYFEYARGRNSYGVFLGGDYPLMRIRSDVNNNRKIVVIKDSYGNAFVPYLAAHYQEVYVIDYRHYKGNIRQLIRDNKIKEVVFAHNNFVVCNKFAAKQAHLFLDNPNPA